MAGLIGWGEESKNEATDDVTPVYEDDKETQLLLMLFLLIMKVRKRSY